MRKMISELNFIIIFSRWGIGPGNNGENGSYACGLLLKCLSGS